jgi:hypothetical protein
LTWLRRAAIPFLVTGNRELQSLRHSGPAPGGRFPSASSSFLMIASSCATISAAVM